MEKHRTPIGFKASINSNESTVQTLELPQVDVERLNVLMKIAVKIDSQMQSFSKSVIKNQAFYDHFNKDIEQDLNKIYTKFYEPI